MKIECPHCRKSYEIPDERLSNLGDQVTFPCPACKEKIEIDLKAKKTGKPKESVPTPDSTRGPTGEVLKKRILRTLNDLPPMPQVAEKGRKVVANEKSSFTDLAKVIETDQSIATRVLKMANTSFYATRGKVTSLRRASVTLGMKTLNELLTLACANSVLGSELKGYGLESGDLWKHSLAVAGCARNIANKKNPGLADDAFSAGLIHDCGKLILDQYVFERSEEFQDYLDKGGKSFLQAEKHVLGFDHAEIASEVCEKWKISKSLTTAIRYHHYPSRTREDELSYIVHAADSIALMSCIGLGIDAMMYRIEEKDLEFLRLDEEDILMAETMEYVEKTVCEI